MAIQQVASGSSNGILGFLFQDDGSNEGTVLEGAEFARTLRQLLGEEGAQDDEAPSDELAGKTAATPDSASLAAELDGLAADFALPAQDPALQPETDGDEPEAGDALWNLASFADMMAKTHAQSTVPADASMGEAKALADATQHGAASEATAASAATATSKIQNVHDLARDAEQAAAQAALAQVSAPQAQSTSGRSTPASGKFLPQGYRPAANALSQSMAGARFGATARDAQIANAANDALPVGGSEGAFSSAFNNNFISDLLGADARTPQNNNATAPNFVQGLNAARIDNPLPAAKATAESAPLPHFDAPFLAGSDAWFEDLGTRLEWLTEMNLEKAELQLHPAELGLLEIQISTGDDGTNVSFITHNADARALIEDNMPKLRELLAHQGMQLGDSQVSQQSAQQRGARDTEGMPTGASGDTRAEDEAPARRTVYVRDPSRIDHYV